MERDVVLRAVERTVPAEEVPAWMHAPNLDLGNRTPQEAIERGDYEPVIEALWLREPAGPVS